MQEVTAKEKLNSFFSQFKKQTYKKGEILVRADENPSGIFYLKEGQVKVYTISEKGEEIILNIYKPGAFFPMTWALNNTQNTYFYEALTSLVLWKGPREEVVTFIQTTPEVMFDLLCRTYRGIDGLLNRMTHTLSGSARLRVVSEIIIAAKRFGTAKENFIVVPISGKDLALQIGLSRETVSREVSQLKKENLVTFSNKTLTILNLQKLTSILS